MIHLTLTQLSVYLDGELRESSSELVRRHLETCEECKSQLAALSEQEAGLARLLIHDAGDEFFARLEARIGRPETRADKADWIDRSKHRTGATKPEKAAKAERRVEPPKPEKAEPRAAATKPAAPEARVKREKPVAAKTPAVPVERVEHEKPPRPPKPEPTRSTKPEPTRPSRQPAVPWPVAVGFALIVGAIAYVLPRADRVIDVRVVPREDSKAEPPVERPARAREPRSGAIHRARAAEREAPVSRATPAPERPAPTPARPAPAVELRTEDPSVGVAPPPDVQPARPVGSLSALGASPERTPVSPPAAKSSTPIVAPSPEPPAPPDEFASIPAAARPLVAAARRASRVAASDSTAARLDAAADAWERAIPALDEAHRTLARRYAAAARYGAWWGAPDPYRAAAATAALRTYLVFAPPGPDRDVARAQLARIGRG